jgi:hypothetical protein
LATLRRRDQKEPLQHAARRLLARRNTALDGK